jgi:nucleotide sugar dehydrogenase
MRFSPGAGVGGHCIPIDPYLLIEKATSNGLDSRFLQTAREVNDRMPEYVAEKTIDTLLEARILPQDARVLLLGKAFKPNVPDERNSPYFTLREELEDYSATIETYDPILSEDSTVDSPYSDVDAVVIVTDHDEFEDLKPESFADVGVKVVVDGRNVLEPDEVRDAGLHYAGVGRI